MTTPLSDYTHDRFASQKNIWFASVRPNSRPHLVPVWFIWYDEKLFICIEPTSVKAKNLEANPYVTLAIEDASKPVICEGEARTVSAPWPPKIFELFERKYDWDLAVEDQYKRLIEVTPRKWLAW